MTETIHLARETPKKQDDDYKGGINPGQVVAAARQYTRQGDYWLHKLSGNLVKTSFPYDYNEPGPGTAPGAPAAPVEDTVPFELNGQTFSRLMRLTNGSDPKLHMVITAGLAVLLYYYTGHNDIILGTSIYKQEIKGEFVNTVLALRTQIEDHMTFKEFLLQVRQTYIEAFENQTYPIDTLLYKLDITSSEKGFPLFDAALLLENIHDKNYIRHIETSIMFLLLKQDHRIRGQVEYNALRYRRTTIERIIKQFTHLIHEVLRTPDLRVMSIDILPGEEKKRLLYEFNDTRTEDVYPGSIGHPGYQSIARLFEEQVNRTPDDTAVVFKDTETHDHVMVTYRELNKRASQLAGVLGKKGVKTGHIIGIMTHPAIEMITGIIAVLKAGSAYLPIDPQTPGNRITYMLKDSAAPLLLTRTGPGNPPAVSFNGPIINISDPSIYKEEKPGITINRKPGDLLYVIYTSGTTGSPKGVMVENKNLINYITWFLQETRVTARDKAILTSSFAFDLGYTVIYAALLKGGELHILCREIYLEPGLFLDYTRNHRITYLKATPSFFSILVNNPGFSMATCSTLRLVILGGEPIRSQDVKKAHLLCHHLRIMNHYGPTETTIGTVAQFIDFHGFEEYAKAPTIGKPVYNTSAYVLGKGLNLLPLGVKGELCISGENVARGYLNHTGLTAEKFVDNPYAPGKKLYRIGDLARWHLEGTLEFLGRADHQVKIRGFRIETAEIESVLLKHKDIKETSVIVRKDANGSDILCAYFVTHTPAPSPRARTREKNPTCTPQGLREFLSNILPDYMIPSYFVPIEEMPLTPNGKIDRQKLPEPELKAENGYIPPGNEMETKMAKIWSDVLGVPVHIIGIDSDFFELGGHSLLATILVSKVRKEFEVNVPLAEIFKTPTIRMLAKYIIDSEKGIFAIQDENLVLLSKGEKKAKHIFLVHAGGGVVEGYREVCNMLTPAFNYWGIQADKIENYTPRNLTNEEVAARYIEKIKKIQPHGPYYLVGWCIGGTIAFEMVNQLEQAGESIGLLILLNSIAPQKNLLPMDVVEFTREAELSWVNRNFPEGEFKEKLKSAEKVEQIWPFILEYLEKNNYDKQTIMNLFAALLKHERPMDKDPIPNFDQLEIRELIYFFSVIRTYRKVRAAYIPAKKIHTQAHFVAARKSEITNRECWNNYCHKPLKFYETPGDHFSIWKEPDAVEFSRLFSRLLRES